MKKAAITIFVLAISIALSASTKQKKKVATLGDSVTFGATISNPADNYPSQLQLLLGDDYEVVNFGVNSQCMQMLGRDIAPESHQGDCAYRNNPRYKELLAYKPDIVILGLGGNDSKNCNWLEDSPERLAKDMNLLIDELKANSHPEIYIAIPLRVKREDWTINEHNLHQIIDVEHAVAKKRHLKTIENHEIFEKVLGDDWGNAYNDGVHPNPLGAKIVAQNVYDTMMKKKK